jgi:hypothetical protein
MEIVFLRDGRQIIMTLMVVTVVLAQPTQFFQEQGVAQSEVAVEVVVSDHLPIRELSVRAVPVEELLP